MKYIDADKLMSGIESINLFPQKSADYNDGREDMKMVVLDTIDALAQDETQVDKMLCSQAWWEEQGWIMIPPDATIEGIDSLLRQVKKKLQQEQPETDGDNGKFVKILVRKEFAEQLQKLGDEIRAGQFSFVGAMNQREQSDFPITDEQVKEFLATHPKIEVPEKYKNPDWLFKKQEQPEVEKR